MMNIQHKEAGNKGKFFIEKDGIEVAEMTYRLTEPGIMTIEHTQVDGQLKGQNIGYELVQDGVDFAREKQLKIIPLCSFAMAVFKKKSAEYDDVLKK